MNTKKYLKIFWELLKTDLIVFRKNFPGQLLDCIIWVTLTMLVATYVLPNLGMTKEYGILWLGAAIASWAIFESWPSIITFISDSDNNNHISYQLTLPIPSWAILIKRIAGYAINTAAMTMFILPLGKIVAFKNINLSNFSVVKFITIFFAVNIFASTFAHFLITLVPNLDRIGAAWIRVLFPLWFLGGANFPWHVIYKMNPIYAYISLLNPVVYMMEGCRAAVMGQANFLPVWGSVLALFGFTLFFGTITIFKLKKRLDFV